MFTTVRQVYLFCADVELSVHWYEQFLGVSQDLSERIEGQFALIRLGETELCFHLADEKSPVSTGGGVVYWLVPSVEAAVARALKFHGELYRGPIQVREEPRWMAQVKDPLGNVFGVEGEK